MNQIKTIAKIQPFFVQNPTIYFQRVHRHATFVFKNNFLCAISVSFEKNDFSFLPKLNNVTMIFLINRKIQWNKKT